MFTMFKCVTILSILLHVITRCSVENTCDIVNSERYEMESNYTNFKPSDTAVKEMTVSSVTECATLCYNDVTCLAFVFSKDDVVCSTYSKVFKSMSLEDKNGTVAYGKANIDDEFHYTAQGRFINVKYNTILIITDEINKV